MLTSDTGLARRDTFYAESQRVYVASYLRLPASQTVLGRPGFRLIIVLPCGSHAVCGSLKLASERLLQSYNWSL